MDMLSLECLWLGCAKCCYMVQGLVAIPCSNNSLVFVCCPFGHPVAPSGPLWGDLVLSLPIVWGPWACLGSLRACLWLPGFCEILSVLACWDLLHRGPLETQRGILGSNGFLSLDLSDSLDQASSALAQDLTSTRSRGSG